MLVQLNFLICIVLRQSSFNHWFYFLHLFSKSKLFFVWNVLYFNFWCSFRLLPWSSYHYESIFSIIFSLLWAVFVTLLACKVVLLLFWFVVPSLMFVFITVGRIIARNNELVSCIYSSVCSTSTSIVHLNENNEIFWNCIWQSTGFVCVGYVDGGVFVVFAVLRRVYGRQ